MSLHGAIAKAFFAQAKAMEKDRDEWRDAYFRMEACDCIPAPLSSKACGKCGRRGVVTEKTMNSMMVEAGKTKAALEMLWKYHLLPLHDEQKAQVKEALGITDPVPVNEVCRPCEGEGSINGHRCYACNGVGLRPHAVIF